MDKRIQKVLDERLSNYATQEDVEKSIDKYFNNRVVEEEKKRLWNSLSPRLKAKVLKHVSERRNADAKKK